MMRTLARAPLEAMAAREAAITREEIAMETPMEVVTAGAAVKEAAEGSEVVATTMKMVSTFSELPLRIKY